MNAREIERALAAADPLGAADREVLARLDFEAMESDLLADAAGDHEPEPAFVPPPRHRARRPALALGVAAVVAAIAVVLVLALGDESGSSRAYGAEQIAFAESTPLLLLEGPGWRVEDVSEQKTREGNEGAMEFVTGKPIPYWSQRSTGNMAEGEKVIGLPPLSVRERKVELHWRSLKQESLATAIANRRGSFHGHAKHFIRLPVLGTTAFVDTRAEIYENQGGPHEREAVALWAEGGDLLELRAAVPDLAAFEERLGWLTKVDSEAWLDAMPAKVVKAADHEAVVGEMLRGIPLPKTFARGRIPDEELTTNRYQVGVKVAGTVACLWLRQWGEADRTGDAAAKREATAAMATSRHWPILREMNPFGDYPEVLWEKAAAMKRGYWEFDGHKGDLLAHSEGLDCARFGLPLLPKKMKLQRERGVPLPPD
jgi:hypothetical protein